MRKLRFVVLALMVLIAGAWTAPQTVTLSIPGMTCATCPITIKAALKKVPGVTAVTVSYAKREAVITFDDARTDTAALIKATTDAGYPAKIKAGGPGRGGPR